MIELRERRPLGKSFCCIEPGTAIALSGALGAGGSIFSSIFGASASRQQAEAIRYSADVASRTALEMDNRARADVAPFRQQGIDAGTQVMRLLTGSSDDVINQVHESPIFQFQSELGMRNINRELSARGLFGSGAGLEILQRFNNQLVGEEADRLFSRLFQVNAMGANAASHMATNTSETGRAVAGIQAQSGIAAAQAEGDATRATGGAYSGTFNALAGGFQQFAQYKLYQPLMNKLASGLPGRDPLFDATDSPGSFALTAP